jgi:hypothetical protein
MYFNNIEQGANSTASPQLQVSGNKVKTSEPAENTQEVLQSETSGNLVAGNMVKKTTVTETEVKAVDDPAKPSSRKWKLGLGASALAGKVAGLSGNNPINGAASLTFFPLKMVGLTLFAGSNLQRSYVGGDLEIVPLRLTFLETPDFLELAGLIGASSISREYESKSGFGANAWGTVHTGARASLNFNSRYGLTAVARTNITDRASTNYVMAEAGLTIRL